MTFLARGSRPAVFAAALVFATLLALAVWNPAGEFWTGVEPPKAQCEAYDAAKLATLPRATEELYDPVALRRLFREPQNTVSNFAYLAVGLFVWLRSRTVAARTFALACGFLAAGSGLYHASLLPEWRLLDMMGVYAALFTLVAAGLRLGEHRPRPLRLVAHGAVFLAAAWCAIHRNDFRWWDRFKPLDSTNLVLALIGALALLAGRAVWRAPPPERRRAWSLFAALAVFGPLAGAGGQGDRFAGFWADPHAMIQGHSVWHVCGAAALGVAFVLFAEPPAGTTQNTQV